jgi:hypothetical protein
VKDERPRLEAGGAVGDPRHDHLTAPQPSDTGPVEPAGPVPVRDKLRWTWSDIEALTGFDRRWMQMEISAGRMPRPDLRAGRRAGFKPSTITAWLDAMAASQGRRRP